MIKAEYWHGALTRLLNPSCPLKPQGPRPGLGIVISEMGFRVEMQRLWSIPRLSSFVSSSSSIIPVNIATNATSAGLRTKALARAAFAARSSVSDMLSGRYRLCPLWNGVAEGIMVVLGRHRRRHTIVDGFKFTWHRYRIRHAL